MKISVSRESSTGRLCVLTQQQERVGSENVTLLRRVIAGEKIQFVEVASFLDR